MGGPILVNLPHTLSVPVSSPRSGSHPNSPNSPNGGFTVVVPKGKRSAKSGNGGR
jgi:hypothetical protein